MSADAARAAMAVSVKRRAVGFAIALAALAVCAVLSLMVGSEPLSVERLLAGLRGTDPEAATILHDLRLPRTVFGLLVGAALGVSGAVMQSFTRNPLADPGILGVNAGAALGVAVAVAVFGVTSLTGTVWYALIGALLTTGAVYLIGSAGGGDPLRITLAGVALGACLSGVTSAITLLLPETFDRMRGWNAGSIAAIPGDQLAWLAPMVGAGLVLALLIAKPLDAIALGDEMAVSLGSSLVLTRILAIVSSTLLCAAATASAGPIGFVGLMVPHAVRWFTGPGQRWIFAGSVVAAPVLLLISDIAGRVVLRGGELQVGIVTAFIGAPVLIALVRRRKASGL